MTDPWRALVVDREGERTRLSVAVPAALSAILEGQISGRTVVRPGAEETQAPR